GLYVLSDLTLESRPCRRRYGTFFKKGLDFPAVAVPMSIARPAVFSVSAFNVYDENIINDDYNVEYYEIAPEAESVTETAELESAIEEAPLLDEKTSDANSEGFNSPMMEEESSKDRKRTHFPETALWQLVNLGLVLLQRDEFSGLKSILVFFFTRVVYVEIYSSY
ncbi:hypothetical protein Avbf_09829, partial [Armadillidium vulgare]